MTVPLDVRYGLRKLNNNVGFTVVTVACLALGICACITVFSVVNAMLLRPIPGVGDQDGLVSLMPHPVLMAGMGEPVVQGLSYPVFLRYREGSATFSALVAYQGVPVNLALAGEGLRVKGQLVTDNYFTALGLRPAAGRFFVPGEGAREAQPAVVVSHALWQHAFARHPKLGRVVSLNGHPFLVIGVAPPGFRGTQHEEDLDVWMPIETAPLVRSDLSSGDLRDPQKGWLFGFLGRLTPGVDLKRARREMDLLANRLGEEFPREQLPKLQVFSGLRVHPGIRGPLARPLTLLASVVGLLMLVVCANLGALLLVRASARQEEIGVRLALGGTRGRLVLQLLAESVTLSVAGGTAGFVLSLWTVDALQGLSLGRFLPRMTDLSVDARVVAFTVTVSLGTGVLFGLLPALWSTRRRSESLLRRATSHRGLDRGRARLQEVFVTAQVTVSLLLLVMTGLFLRTLWNLQSVDPGFDSSNVLNLRLNLALQKYPHKSGSEFFEQLLPQVRELRGVRSATLVSWVPLSRGNDFTRFTTLRLRTGAKNGSNEVWSQFSAVFPGYFRDLGIPFLGGQDFSPADRQGSTPVVIVDETLAARLWPARNPLGEQVEIRGGMEGESQIREVVGVVRSVRLRRLQEQPEPLFYLPFAQHYEPAMTLQVRTEGNPLQVVSTIRAILRKMDPDLGSEVRRFDQEVEEALAQPKLFSWLLGSFSLTALLVTAIGLYATLAYTVSRRTRELGIRMALGARAFEIVAMVLRRGLFLTTIGLVLGLTAASWVTSEYESLLFGVTPTDPGVFVSVALLLMLVGLAASSLPAYSATRVDPMAVIRHE